MSGGRAPIQVTVTGGAGQIGYSLLFRAASGQMFGQDQPLFLRLLEVQPAMNAPEIPEERWFAMTRLDENRARTQLAQKAKVPVAAISNVAVWGNHSTTQYPDAHNARIAGLPVEEVIKDHGWLKGKFVEIIQKRGAAVIEARGASSAASAANAVIDSVVSIRTPTPWGDWHSLAVVSKGEYKVPEGLQFGFPVRSDGDRWEVVPDLQHDDDAWKRIEVTTKELLQEREMVKELIPTEA